MTVGTRRFEIPETQVAPAGSSGTELMLRFQGGEEIAFSALVGKYRAPVVRFLYRILANQPIAEELGQEVFLRVYCARRRYTPTAQFETWLFRIARNLALNALRDHRPELPPAAGEQQCRKPAEALSSAAPLADQLMLQAEHAAAVREAVQSLPARQRVAVCLHKYEEMDYGQIARILRCSQSALKSLLFRAYQNLRERLSCLPERSGLPARRSSVS